MKIYTSVRIISTDFSELLLKTYISVNVFINITKSVMVMYAEIHSALLTISLVNSFTYLNKTVKITFIILWNDIKKNNNNADSC